MKKLHLSVLASAVLSATAPALAYEAGDVLIKFGPAMVAPESDSQSKILGLQGEVVEVDDGVGFGISGTYMMTDAIGVELLGATPFEHDIDGLGTVLGGTRVGSTEHLPPTLLVNYYVPVSDVIKPYVGVGYNYTTFFNEDTTAELDGLLGADYTSLSLSDSHGVAYEIGFDIPLEDNLVFTATAWNVDIDTTATVKANSNLVEKIDVEIDPWVYMVGLGMKF